MIPTSIRPATPFGELQWHSPVTGAGIEAVTEFFALRKQEGGRTEAVRRGAARQLPVLVGGDFNTPAFGSTLTSTWRGFTNTSRSGRIRLRLHEPLQHRLPLAAQYAVGPDRPHLHRSRMDRSRSRESGRPSGSDHCASSTPSSVRTRSEAIQRRYQRHAGTVATRFSPPGVGPRDGGADRCRRAGRRSSGRNRSRSPPRNSPRGPSGGPNSPRPGRRSPPGPKPSGRPIPSGLARRTVERAPEGATAVADLIESIVLHPKIADHGVVLAERSPSAAQSESSSAERRESLSCSVGPRARKCAF